MASNIENVAVAPKSSEAPKTQDPVARVSAKACGPNGIHLTEAEIEAAEEEALAWARKSNCC